MTACTFGAQIYVHVYSVPNRWENLRRLYFKEFVQIEVIRRLVQFSAEKPRRGQYAAWTFPLHLHPVLQTVSSFTMRMQKYKKSPVLQCKTTFGSHLLSEKAEGIACKINSWLIGMMGVDEKTA